MDVEMYYNHQEDDGVAISMRNAEFAWQNSSFQLGRLNMRLFKGKFVGVIGQVGSGKTTFLHSITGELNKLGGKISINNREQGIRLVSGPWLASAYVDIGPISTAYVTLLID